MSEIKTLIKSQITKNGISGKRTNIGEILTLPVYNSGVYTTPIEITVNFYEFIPSPILIGINNYFIMKNDNNQILLYKSDGTLNNLIIIGNYTFTINSSNYVINNKIYSANSNGVIELLNYFDTTAKVLYVNGIIETLTNGETFVADGKLYIKIGSTLSAFIPV
jgi:hypothetical protein